MASTSRRHRSGSPLMRSRTPRAPSWAESTSTRRAARPLTRSSRRGSSSPRPTTDWSCRGAVERSSIHQAPTIEGRHSPPTGGPSSSPNGNRARYLPRSLSASASTSCRQVKTRARSPSLTFHSACPRARLAFLSDSGGGNLVPQKNSTHPNVIAYLPDRRDPGAARRFRDVFSKFGKVVVPAPWEST